MVAYCENEDCDYYITDCETYTELIGKIKGDGGEVVKSIERTQIDCPHGHEDTIKVIK